MGQSRSTAPTERSASDKQLSKGFPGGASISRPGTPSDAAQRQEDRRGQRTRATDPAIDRGHHRTISQSPVANHQVPGLNDLRPDG